MWGAAGQPEFLAALSQLSQWCFHPTHLQANQEVAVWVGREGAGVPTKCLMLLLPCTARGPCSVPSPRDSQALPLCCLAQSGALRDTAGLCPARACREGAGCPLQASPASCWLCSTHGSCGTHGTRGTQGSWFLLLQPWSHIHHLGTPRLCPPERLSPMGVKGLGKVATGLPV